MNSSLKEIIKLVESSPDSFYDHISKKRHSSKIEIQFIDSNWRFCLVPYTNSWTAVKSPTDILGLDLSEFKEKATQLLLTEYYCYHHNIISNDFRRKRIEKVLGIDLCLSSLIQMEKFKLEIRKLLLSSLSGDPKLVE